MADDRPTPTDRAEHDLRTITNRLVDLQRKCRSVSSRSDEALEIEQRIASVLERLQDDDREDDEPIPFAGLARELYAVERFFESNGFLSVAKEVAHVERSLDRLATPDEPEHPVRPASTPGALSDTSGGVEEEPDDDMAEPSSSRWAVSRPVAAVLLLLVVAIAVCVGILLNRDRILGRGPDAAATAPTPRPLPTAPAQSPTPVPHRDPSEPVPGAVLAEAIGQARLALVDDDIETAMDHLSRAAIVDSDHGAVLSTAGQIIERLVENADRAAEAGLWDVADLTLARADRVATRFGLDATAIEQAARRYARMDRFQLVVPSDSATVNASSGRRVTIHFKDGSTRESVLKGASEGMLLLDEDTEVRGGAVYYVDEIPIAEIDYLKIWED